MNRLYPDLYVRSILNRIHGIYYGSKLFLLFIGLEEIGITNKCFSAKRNQRCLFRYYSIYFQFMNTENRYYHGFSSSTHFDPRRADLIIFKSKKMKPVDIGGLTNSIGYARWHAEMEARLDSGTPIVATYSFKQSEVVDLGLIPDTQFIDARVYRTIFQMVDPRKIPRSFLNHAIRTTRAGMGMMMKMGEIELYYAPKENIIDIKVI